MHEASRQRSIIIVLAAVALVAAAAAWAMTGSAGDSRDSSSQGSSASSESSGDAAAVGESTGSTGSGKAGSDEAGSGGGDSGTTGAGAGTSGTQGSGTEGSGASGGGGSTQGGDQGGGNGNDQGGGGKGGDGGDTGGDDATTDVEEPGTATGETVPVEPVQTMAPVPLQSVGDFKTGLTVELASITAVQAEAKAPGEISGPGLRVTVAAANDGQDAVSLDGVVVFLSYGSDRTPATQFGSSSEPLAGDLSPGSSRQGTYVFTVPPDQRDDVRVEVSYTGSAPTVAFTGSVDG